MYLAAASELLRPEVLCVASLLIKVFTSNTYILCSGKTICRGGWKQAAQYAQNSQSGNALLAACMWCVIGRKSLLPDTELMTGLPPTDRESAAWQWLLKLCSGWLVNGLLGPLLTKLSCSLWLASLGVSGGALTPDMHCRLRLLLAHMQQTD